MMRVFGDTDHGFSAAPLRARQSPGTAVLLILHQEHSTPGRVGRLLAERGFRLDIRRPRFGDPLPTSFEHHAGAIIFGGPMSANDADDWVRDEIDFAGRYAAAGLPFLGICLGAQMLARAIGGTVAPHPEGKVEIGYYPLMPTPAGRALRAEWPGHVYHWHREGFTLPAGTEVLATGDAFEMQAFRVGEKAIGLQFHPEVTHAMMCRWTTKAHERLTLPNARCREEHFTGRLMHDNAVRRWLDGLLDLWIGRAALAATR